MRAELLATHMTEKHREQVARGVENAKEFQDMLGGMTPGVGVVYEGYKAITGYNPITEREMSATERGLSGVVAVLGIIPAAPRGTGLIDEGLGATSQAIKTGTGAAELGGDAAQAIKLGKNGKDLTKATKPAGNVGGLLGKLNDAPKTGLLRDSLMSLRNKVPSNPLTKAEMKQFADELREFGVFVQYGKKYEDGKDILRFMPVGPGRAQLDLPTNATWYEALHEAGHFRDWIARGKPSRADWLKIPYHEREKAVYDWIKANWWDDLTPDQQSDAFLQWMVEYQKFLRGE